MVPFSLKMFIEFFAFYEKLQIQCNDNLNPVEKELLKAGIDVIKKKVQGGQD